MNFPEYLLIENVGAGLYLMLSDTTGSWRNYFTRGFHPIGTVVLRESNDKDCVRNRSRGLYRIASGEAP